MGLGAALGDPADERQPLGEREPAHHLVAHRLVVADDRAHRAVDVAGLGVAGRLGRLDPGLDRRLQQPLLGAELADHGAGADPGAGGDRVERGVELRVGAEELLGGVEDRLAGPLGRVRAPRLGVGARRHWCHYT